MSTAQVQSMQTARNRAAPFDLNYSFKDSILDREIRTLILDDSEFDRKRIERMCNDTGLSFKFTGIDSIHALRPVLDAQKFDFMLIDFRLTESDGLAAVRRVRSHPAHINCAILMLTGQTDIAVAVEAMKAGCSDYLDKGDMSSSALRRSMINALEKTSLQNELMRARGLQDKLQHIVTNFADENASEMKPIVLKMMRQARSRLASPVSSKDKDLQDIDLGCRKLWSLIESMETNALRIE